MKFSEYELPEEFYEEIKSRIIADQQKERLDKHRIELASQIVFNEAKEKYYEKLAERFSEKQFSRDFGWHIFDAIQKIALAIVKAKTSREAYLHGNAQKANKVAEKLCEVLLSYKEK